MNIYEFFDLFLSFLEINNNKKIVIIIGENRIILCNAYRSDNFKLDPSIIPNVIEIFIYDRDETLYENYLLLKKDTTPKYDSRYDYIFNELITKHSGFKNELIDTLEKEILKN